MPKCDEKSSDFLAQIGAQEVAISIHTVQPAQVRNLMNFPYFFIIGRFGDFLS